LVITDKTQLTSVVITDDKHEWYFLVSFHFLVFSSVQEIRREGGREGVFWLRTGICGRFCEHANTVWRIYPV